MRAPRVSAILTFVLAAAACSNAREAQTSPKTSGATSHVVSARDLDVNDFHRSTTIDNVWFPVRPGTRLTWEGHAFDEGERIDRRVVFTVTDMTKMIQGVRTLVVSEIDYNDDVLGESELIFFAQDDEGNVWLMGEYPEEWEDGRVVKAPAWIDGYQGARAGLTMKAEPKPDAPSYAQGWGPKIGWNDRAIVFDTAEHTCVPADCYGGVLVMREFNPDIPHASQLKYYAPGTGNVRVGWLGKGEEEREVLVLVSEERLTSDEQAALREAALEQEARAYRISDDVYGQTAPMEPLSSA